MAKNDHAHAIRLMDGLRRHIGNEAAEEMAEKYPLSKSATIQKKYDWAKNVCNYLDSQYAPETVLALRKECRCNDGKSIANQILKYLRKADRIEQFVKTFNENETFASF